MTDKVTIVKQDGKKIEISLDRLLNILDYARAGYESAAKTSPKWSTYKQVCEHGYRVALDLACALED